MWLASLLPCNFLSNITVSVSTLPTLLKSQPIHGSPFPHSWPSSPAFLFIHGLFFTRSSWDHPYEVPAKCVILHLLERSLPVWLAPWVRMKKAGVWEARFGCSSSAFSHSLQPHYPHAGAGAQAIASGYESQLAKRSSCESQYAETELAGSGRGQSCFLDVINRKGVGQPQSENQFFYGVRCLQFRAHRKFLTFFYYPGKCSCFGGIVSVQQTFVLNLRQRCE